MRAVDEQPALQAALTIGAPSTASSTPIIAPLTRTSWISGQRGRSASKRCAERARRSARPRASRPSASMVSMVARAARQASGLPPNVAACVPGRSFSATSGRATRPPQRHAAGQRLGQRHASGWTVQCW